MDLPHAQIAGHLPRWLLPALALFFLLNGLWSYGSTGACGYAPSRR